MAHMQVTLGLLMSLQIAPVVMVRAQSDTSQTVRVGVRVRIDTASGVGSALTRIFLGRMGAAGRVIDINADSLVVLLDRPDTTATFAFANVSRLEISRGRHSRLQDAAIGAAGGVGGGLLSLAVTDAMLGSFADASSGLYARYALVGGAVGFATGLVFGGQERWKRVQAPLVSVVPGRGNAGLALTVAISF